MNHRFPRLLGTVLIIALLFCSVFPAYAQDLEPTPYPDALKITIAKEEWTDDAGTTYQVSVPVTALENVNQQLRQAQEQLWQDAMQHSGEDLTVEMKATYRISGDKWAGFFLTGRVMRYFKTPDISYEQEQTMYLCYDMLTFDMETGNPLTLADVFPEESEAWAQIEALVSEKLNAYYPDEEKNQEAIDALSNPERLMSCSFLPSAGRLLIAAPLWEVCPDHWQIVHTILPYPDFRPMMTEDAFAQTDNSHRPIIAITYDDGPVNTNTKTVLDFLNDFGASATFFCIGRSVAMWPDVVRHEMDDGHTVGSHTYKHKYDYQVNEQYLIDDRIQCRQIHQDLTGLAPELFRAPGGNFDKYLAKKIGWPIILWRFSAGDTGNNNAYQLASRIVYNSKNGDIILMHDIHRKTARGTGMFLEELAAKGFLFATVDELLYLHGITPQPDTVYYSAFMEPVTEPR